MQLISEGISCTIDFIVSCLITKCHFCTCYSNSWQGIWGASACAEIESCSSPSLFLGCCPFCLLLQSNVSAISEVLPHRWQHFPWSAEQWKVRVQNITAHWLLGWHLFDVRHNLKLLFCLVLYFPHLLQVFLSCFFVFYGRSCSLSEVRKSRVSSHPQKLRLVVHCFCTNLSLNP